MPNAAPETVSTAAQPANVSTNTYNPWRFCLAPMMDWSDRHCRYLWRLMSKQARLYTEMVVTGAILHGDKQRFLHFSQAEQPLALQLGGSDASELAQCAKIAEDWGYDEVNLNCGCPSDRVQKGKIGAILMREPELVAECVAAMQAQCSIPITVKHRIGVDDVDDYASLERFVAIVAETGCSTFIIHARKAWLKGLSPKQNREVPPLDYDRVQAIKQRFPNLNIVINGGITELAQANTLLHALDGVMVGREAYSNPFLLNSVDQLLFNQPENTQSRCDVVRLYAEYCRDEIASGNRLHHMSRHVLGMFNGQHGGRLYRRYISEHAPKAGASEQVLLDAIAHIRDT